jgi:hypothetical protein
MICCFSTGTSPTAMSEDRDPRVELASALEDSDAAAHLTLAWRLAGPGYKVQLVELEQSVAATFLEYARSIARQLTEREELDYDPEWPLKDHEYFALDEGELPGVNLFTAIADFQSLDTFRKKNLTKPRLYVVAIQTGEGIAFFGRRMAYLKVLKQTAGIFAATWDGSTFNALTDSVATFSTGFDWVYWNEVLYVLDANAFHAEFRDTAALREAVAEHMASLGERLTIVNAEEMTKRCQSSVPMASKLKRVSETGLHLTSPQHLQNSRTTRENTRSRSRGMARHSCSTGPWKASGRS